MEQPPEKLLFATAWINTWTAGSKICRANEPLDYCDKVANGFGIVMKAAGHIWAIERKEDKADPADWVAKNVRSAESICTVRGNDTAPGRGINTVDFAIVVSHGGIPDPRNKIVSVGFSKKPCRLNKDPCRFCSDQTRFGNGKLKWVILDCCYSLEIDEANGFTPWAIWRQSFHGLHTIFGFTGQTTDSLWTSHRGQNFAFMIVQLDLELAEAWIDSAYSLWCNDRPVAAAAGRDREDANKRIETESLSRSFDSIPNKEVKTMMWVWRS
jgi:hypothetical protein